MPAGEALKLTLAIYDVVSDTHGADMTVGWATTRRQRVAALHNQHTTWRRTGPVRGYNMQQRLHKAPLSCLLT